MTQTPRPSAWPSPDSAEQRTVAALRLVLAASALGVVWIDPTQPASQAGHAYLALCLYTTYSAAFYAATLLESAPAAALRPFEPWIDVAWYLALVALTGGASSLFFVLFFFPILVASFRSGFAVGMGLTAVSTLVFLAVAGAVSRGGADIEWNRFLLRPVYLLGLGWVISQRGGFETLLKRRLALLKEIGRLSNPRLGTDRTLGSSLERLRRFYDADDCLLITSGRADEGARIRRAARDAPERSQREDPLPADLAGTLLALPAQHALVYQGPGRRPSWRAPGQQFDVARGEPVPLDRALLERLAEWFAAGSFVSVPVLGHGRSVGRLYVSGPSARLRPDDVSFLLQVVDQLLPILENVRLVDRLAASAAEEERQKIARDVHDSIIQPYIGLQIGLSALHNRLAAGEATPGGESSLRPVAEQVARLLAVTDSGIADLRRFVARLRGGAASEKGFVAILESFARRFSELTDIAVQVEAADGLHINDRLAAEVFQMAAEGLSNVRRHTEAKRAWIQLSEADGALRLAIENDGPRAAPSFRPRSLAGRAESLQGWTTVEGRPDGGTRVLVTIPL
jgi:signal transduction histidine kinase